MLSRRLKLRIASTASIAIAALSVGAASANAGVLVNAAPSCDDQPLSQPFTPWLDWAQYTPLGGGNFETGASAGWSLSGGAAIANGNESFYIAGANDSKSLSLPAGSSATSASICVGIEHPTVRFFAKRNSGGLLGGSLLGVEVLYENNLGILESLSIGAVNPSGNWQPTLPMTVLANLLPLLPGEHTPVEFRFTPTLGGNWSVDDIQVDPFHR